MLTLKNKFDDLTLSLSVLGFTNEKDESLDVEIEVKQGDIVFTTSGPFLEAEETWKISRWLEGIFRNDSGYTTDLYFTNSKISFHYLASTEKAIIVSAQINTEDMPDFKIDQSIEESFSDYYPNIHEIAVHRNDESPAHKKHLYFAVKWVEIPVIRKSIKSTSQEFPPHRNEEYEFLKDYKPEKLQKTGISAIFRNDLNDLTFKFTSFGYTREIDSSHDDWITTRLEVIQGDNRSSDTGEHLQPYELKSILEWFKTLSKRRLPFGRSLHFLEPNISFHFYGANRKWVLIGIELGLESELDFIPVQFHPSELKYKKKEELQESDSSYHDFGESMIFNLSLHDFKVIIEGLEGMVAELPDPPWVQEYLKNSNLPD